MAEDTGAGAAVATPPASGADAGTTDGGQGATDGGEQGAAGASGGAKPDTPAAPQRQDTRQGPLSKRDARKGLSEDVKTRLPEDATSDVTKAPPATGAPAKSAATEGSAPAAGTDGRQSAADVGKDGAAEGGTTKDVPAAEAPKPRIRIELPEGHALRGSGRTFVTAEDETEARIIRAGLNSHARLGELSTARGEIRQLREEIARRDASAVARQKWDADPRARELQQQAEQIRETYGEEAAKTFLKGGDASLAELEQKEIAQRMDEIQRTEAASAGKSWKSSKYTEMGAVMPEPVASHREFAGWFDEAVQTFDAKVGMGHYPSLTRENIDATFLAFFQGELAKNPKVMAVMNEVQNRKARETADAAAKAAADKAREDEIGRKAVEDFKRTAAEARRQAPPHPLGNLGQGTGSRVPAQDGAGAQGEKTLDDMTPLEARKRARAGAVQDARASVGA